MPRGSERYAVIIGGFDGQPADLSEQHDDYPHGVPRRGEQ
jgi:hypothetical protein